MCTMLPTPCLLYLQILLNVPFQKHPAPLFIEMILLYLIKYEHYANLLPASYRGLPGP